MRREPKFQFREAKAALKKDLVRRSTNEQQQHCTLQEGRARCLSSFFGRVAWRALRILRSLSSFNHHHTVLDTGWMCVRARCRPLLTNLSHRISAPPPSTAEQLLPQ